MDPMLEDIAATVRNATAQRVLARMGTDYRDEVLANWDCADEVFIELYTTTGKSKVSVNAAKKAVDHCLNDCKLEHLLSVETRPGVLAKAFASIVPTVEELTTAPLRNVLSATQVARTVETHWGPEIDREVLAAMPPADLGGALRVWRLLADSLTDTDVLAELADFDTWAGKGDQVVMSWILHRRPHLIRDLLDNSSLMVKTQVAGSQAMGLLSATEQERILDLHRISEDRFANSQLDTAFFIDRQYAWMAAAGNPTVSVSLLDKIETGLGAVGEANVVRSRRNYNNWDTDSLTKAAEPATRARLVRWASPGEMAKGRPSAFITLFDNDSLSEADVEMMSAAFCRKASSGIDRETWFMPEVRAAFVRAEEKFPTIRGQLVGAWDEAYNRQGPSVLRWERRSPTHPDRHSAGNLDANVYKVRSLNQDAPLQWLSNELGEDEDLWQTAFMMLPTMLDESLADFANTCKAVVS